MGTHKATLLWNNIPWILHHIDALRPFTSALYVVLGAKHSEIRPLIPPDVSIIFNKQWETSQQSDSLLLCLNSLPSTSQMAIVTPIDAIPAPPRVLEALCHRNQKTVPTCREVRGHPVLINTEKASLELQNGHLRRHLTNADTVEVDWECLDRNLNTPIDWQRWTSGDGCE